MDKWIVPPRLGFGGVSNGVRWGEEELLGYAPGAPSILGRLTTSATSMTIRVGGVAPCDQTDKRKNPAMPNLTEEQRAFWDEINFSLLPEDASPEKWKQFISGMQNVFTFDGYDEPSEEALRDEVERRRNGGDGDARITEPSRA